MPLPNYWIDERTRLLEDIEQEKKKLQWLQQPPQVPPWQRASQFTPWGPISTAPQMLGQAGEGLKEYYSRPMTGALSMPWVGVFKPEDPGAQKFWQMRAEEAQKITPAQRAAQFTPFGPISELFKYMPGTKGREAYEKWEAPKYLRGGIEAAVEIPLYMMIPEIPGTKQAMGWLGRKVSNRMLLRAFHKTDWYKTYANKYSPEIVNKVFTAYKAGVRGEHTVVANIWKSLPKKVRTPPTPAVAKISKTAVARPDVVDNITSKIKSWRGAVKGTKALRGPEYTKRFQEYSNLTDDFLKKHPGDIDGATRYAKSALRGKYPDATFDIPTIAKAEVDNLRLYGRQQIIETAGNYGRLGHRIGIDENNLDDALIRIFVNKQPPREFELKLFERALGGEFTRTLANLKQTLGAKGLATFIDAANLPRAVLASFDVSAPMRQGWVLFAKHPFKGFQSMKTMFKALKSEKNAQLIDDAIRTRPNTQKGLESGLELTRRAGTQVGRGLEAMTAREESFMSRFAGKIPGIRMSERAYVTFLNDMRSRVWEGYVPMLQKLGADDATYRGMASLINMASGRGNLGGLRLMSPLLNNMFFSPRLVLSRLQLPTMLMNRNPVVRKEAWKMFLSFMGLNTAIISGLHLAGASVGLDPRSGEFGKVRIGNTRLDFWAGFVQFARFFTQFTLAKRKLQGGKIIEANRKDLLMRMAQSKFAPMMGFLWDLLAGRTYMGEEVIPKDKPELARQVKNRLAPLFIQDMWDAIEDMGPEGIPLALPGAFGVGVITYESSIPPPKPKAGGFGGSSFKEGFGGGGSFKGGSFK